MEALKLRGMQEVYDGPELLSGEFVVWAESVGMMIHYIQPGEPNQNAYIERFNRTYRNELLDLYLFRDLGRGQRGNLLVDDRIQ